MIQIKNKMTTEFSRLLEIYESLCEGSITPTIDEHYVQHFYNACRDGKIDNVIDIYVTNKNLFIQETYIMNYSLGLTIESSPKKLELVKWMFHKTNIRNPSALFEKACLSNNLPITLFIYSQLKTQIDWNSIEFTNRLFYQICLQNCIHIIDWFYKEFETFINISSIFNGIMSNGDRTSKFQILHSLYSLHPSVVLSKKAFYDALISLDFLTLRWWIGNHRKEYLKYIDYSYKKLCNYHLIFHPLAKEPYDLYHSDLIMFLLLMKHLKFEIQEEIKMFVKEKQYITFQKICEK